MKHILVVDDDPAISALLKNRLEFNGYEVSVASNGVQAYAMALERRPDLIMLDVCMPVMDGLQFIKEIRWKEEFKGIPVLIVTARTKTQSLFEEAGFNHFIAKPFNTDRLLNLVDQCLKEYERPQKKKVLIVDDEDDLVELLANRLEANGYEVIKATNGQVGLKKAKEEQPDAMILDIAMPQMDGLQVCQIMKSNPKLKNIPIIFLTSRSTKIDIKVGREVKADAYLTKPFEPKMLLEKVQALAKGV